MCQILYRKKVQPNKQQLNGKILIFCAASELARKHQGTFILAFLCTLKHSVFFFYNIINTVRSCEICHCSDLCKLKKTSKPKQNQNYFGEIKVKIWCLNTQIDLKLYHQSPPCPLL